MIDVDKYEGHTAGPWSKNIFGGLSQGKMPCNIDLNEVSESDAQLIADAPKLLAEVKRLRLLFRELINDMSADEYTEWCNRIGCPDGLEVEAMKND